jgi:hypothetical protein
MTIMNIENQGKYLRLGINNGEQLEEFTRNNQDDLKSFGEDSAKYACDKPPRMGVCHAHTLREGWNWRKCMTKTRFQGNQCDNLHLTNNTECEGL